MKFPQRNSMLLDNLLINNEVLINIVQRFSDQTTKKFSTSSIRPSASTTNLKIKTQPQHHKPTNYPKEKKIDCSF